MPVSALDLAAVESFSDLLEQMALTSFGGRQLGEAAEVLEAMVRDPDCFVVGTFSGAMTVAQQGLVLCDMVEQGMLQAIVTTGALVTHGFIHSAGMTHFKADPELTDQELYLKGYNRVYDTLELEQNLDDTEAIVHEVLGAWEGSIFSSSVISHLLGRYLAEKGAGRSFLGSAYEGEVPVFIPAFTDSELGLDFAIANRLRAKNGLSPWSFDPFVDLEAYTDLVEGRKRLGIFTIGGGVPRNWAQQVGPYLDIARKRVGVEGTPVRFQYGVRICPEPVHWGGLSGCTYREGVSWGKFVPPAEGGRYAEVPSDATIAWPILIKAVWERLER